MPWLTELLRRAVNADLAGMIILLMMVAVVLGLVFAAYIGFADPHPR